MTVRDIYNSFCSTLLERGGLQLGLVTDAQFLSYYTEIMLDFLQQTGLYKTVSVLAQMSGVDSYDLPDLMGEAEHVISQGQSLFKSDESDMANASREWRGQVGSPRAWRQDKEAMQSISLFPVPGVSGNAVSATAEILGTLSSVVAGDDVDIASSGALYGTIGGDSGSVSVISSAPFLGTIAAIACSKSNIAVVGAASLVNSSPGLDTAIEWLQPSFALYIGYGILAKVFGSDGESKDDTRFRYCRARYDEGIALATTIMDEEMQEGEMVNG